MATKCLSPVWKQKASQFAKENNIDESYALSILTNLINQSESDLLSDEELMQKLNNAFNGSIDTSSFSSEQKEIYNQLVKTKVYNDYNKALQAVNILNQTIPNSNAFIYKTSDGTYSIGDLNNSNSNIRYNKTGGELFDILSYVARTQKYDDYGMQREILSKYHSNFYIPKTNPAKAQQLLEQFRVKTLLPEGIFNVEQVGNNTKVTINTSVLNDSIQRDKNNVNDEIPTLFPNEDRQKVANLLNFLSAKTGLKYQTISFERAQQLVEGISQNTNAFVKDGVCYFIQGKQLNTQIASEEMLHPLIHAIHDQNPQLFRNLLREARLSFPKLRLEIAKAYSNDSLDIREEELVTQALSRAFALEKEKHPLTRSIRHLLQYFKEFVQELFNAKKTLSIIGDKDYILLDEINADVKLSDLAQIINSDVDILYNSKYKQITRQNKDAKNSTAPNVINEEYKKNVVISPELQGMATSSQKTGAITLSKASFTPQEVIDHLYGRSGLPFSDQKQKVMELLEKKHGITEQKLKDLLSDDAKATTFVILHERSHLVNQDSYNTKDYLSEKAINIETRATFDAFTALSQEIKQEETVANTVENLMEKEKETPLQKTAKEVDSLIEKMSETYTRHKDFNNEESPYNHVYGIRTTEQEAKAYKREVETTKGFQTITGWQENEVWYKPNDLSVTQTDKNAQKFDKNNPWGLPSSYIGNTVDAFNRDFFEEYEKHGHNLEETAKVIAERTYPNMSQDMLDSLLASMQNVIKDITSYFNITDENYKVITKEFPLGGTKTIDGQQKTVVGTPDMVLIDGKGIVHIIDFKTIRSVASWNEKIDKYTNQVNSYNTLITVNESALQDKIGKPMLLRYDVSYPGPAVMNDQHQLVYRGVAYTSMLTNPNQLYVIVANSYVPIQEISQYQDKNYPSLQGIDLSYSIRYGIIQNIELGTIEDLNKYELTEDEQIEAKEIVTDHAVEYKTQPSVEDEHLANLMYSDLMSASEQQFHADNIMKLFSYMISNLQLNSEMAKTYFPNMNFEDDFTAMSRQDIVQTIGIGNFFNFIKEYYYNPDNEFIYSCGDVNISEKAQFVYDNFDAFVIKGNSKLARLEMLSISKNITDLIEDNGDLNANNETESEATEHQDREHWMVGFRQLSAKSSILNDIKRATEKLKIWEIETDDQGNIIGRYPKKDKYWGVFDETINSDKAVEHILSWCNKCTTIEEMLQILNALAPQHTWLYSIIGLHANNENVDESAANNVNIEGLIEQEPFRSQFFHSFRRDFTNYSVLLLDKNESGEYVWRTKIINTQAASDALMQQTIANFRFGDTNIVQVVNNNVEGKGRVNEDYVQNIENRQVELSKLIQSESFSTPEVQDQVAKDVLQLLQDLGIPALNLSEGQNPIKDIISVDVKSTNNAAGYKINDILKQVSYITKTLLDNKERTDYNPMLKGEQHSTYSNYKNILKIVGPYIEDAVEASVYENGKMYYSFNTPSFLQKEIKRLNNSLGKSEGEYAQYLEDNYGKYNWFKGAGGWRTPWLDMISRDADARINLDHKVQICADKTDFRDLSPFGYAVSIMQEYFAEKNYAWYRVPLLSNKPSNEFIHFKKFTRSNSGRVPYKVTITDYLSDIALQELIRIKSVIENINSASATKIKNFDVSQKILDEHPEIVQKVKAKQALTGKDSEILIESGANFKFFPFLNDYLFGNKSEAPSHLLLDYINGKDLGSQFGELKTWLDQKLTEYMDEKAEKAWDNMTKQGLLNYTSTEKTVGKVKRTYRNYNFLSNLSSKSFNDMKKEILADPANKDLNDEELNTRIQDALYKEVKENFIEFIWNDKLASINIIELTTTDLAFYSGSDDFQKRFAEVHSPTMKLNLTATFKQEKNGKSQEVRYSADGMERSIILKDNKVGSTLVDELENAFTKILSNSKLSQNQKKQLRMMFDTIKGLYKAGEINMTDAQAYSCPTSYRKKMGMAGKFTDAMEEAYQRICQGNFNVDDIGVLMQPLKPFVYGQTSKPALGTAMPLRKVPQQHKNSEYLLFLADAILRGSNTDSKLIALFDFMEDSAYDGRVRVRNGKVYKDGVFERIANSNEKDNTILEEGEYNGKGIDTIQFESAVKAGLQGIIDINSLTDYDEILSTLRTTVYKKAGQSIYGEDSPYDYTDDYDITYVNHISFEDYGIQQEVPNHFKDHEQLIGSQQRIINIVDLSDDAYFEVNNADGTKTSLSKKEIVNEYQSLHAQNIRDSFETLKLDLLLDTKVREDYIRKQVKKAFQNTANSPLQNLESSLQQMTASSRLTDSVSDIKLKNTLMSNIKKVEKYKTSKDIDELVNDVCENVNFDITDAARNQTLSNVLKGEIKKDQRYGADLLYACSINPTTGTFNIPLSDPIQSLRIQQLLHSIIKSRINKQETSGGPVVQTSCYGLSDNLHIIWENGHIKYYECYMPIPSEEIRQAITKADNSIMTPIEAIEAGIIQGTIIDKEKGLFESEQLKAIGYRIPTEDKYSMIPLMIKDWVPAAAGEAIIMPAEITQQTGSDFDIDKMYIMVKSFKKVNKSGLNKKAFKEKVIKQAKRHYKNDKNKLRYFIYGNEKNGGEYGVDHYIDLIAEKPGIKFTRNDKDGIEHRDEKGLLIQSMLSDDLYYKNNFEQYSNLNTREGRNNRIFDIQWGILTSMDSVDKILNPGNFDKLKEINNLVTVLKDPNQTLSYQELTKKSAKELKDLAQKANASVGRNITDFETQLYYFQQNMSAAKLIGAFANNNVSHGFISLLEGDDAINLALDDNKSFRFNGVIVQNNRLDNSLALNGIDRISKNIANFLSASVDAVKDNALAGLNMNTATVNPAMVLARLGFDLESIGLFFSNPIIVETVEKYFIQQDISFTDLNTVIDETIKNIPSVAESNIKEMENSLVNVSFTKEEMANNIISRNPQMDVNMLLLLKKLNIISDQLDSITYLTKFNSVTNAAGPSLANTILMKQKVGKLAKNQLNNPIFNNNVLRILNNSELLKAFYDCTIGKDGAVYLIFSPYFIQMTPTFQAMVANLDSLTQGNLTEKLINQLANDFTLFKLTKQANSSVAPVIDCSYKNREYLFKQFPKDFFEITKDTDNMIKTLLHKTSTGKVPVATLTSYVNGLSTDGQNTVKQEWIDLHKNYGEEVSKAAELLAIYNILRGGFGYSPKTMTHLIPSYIKEQIEGYIPSFNDIRNFSYCSDNEIENVMHQFFRNHTNERKLCPVIDSTKYKGVLDDKGNLSFTFTADNKEVKNMLQVSGSDTNPVYYFMIKYNDKFYINLNGTRAGSANVVSYQETTRLGIPNDFLEYDANQIGSEMTSVFAKSQEQSNEGSDNTEDKENLAPITSKDITKQYQEIISTSPISLENLLDKEKYLLTPKTVSTETIQKLANTLRRKIDVEMPAEISKEIDTIINKLNHLC